MEGHAEAAAEAAEAREMVRAECGVELAAAKAEHRQHVEALAASELELQETLRQQAEKKYECVRWAWTGDVYDRKVFCLEWREKK